MKKLLVVMMALSFAISAQAGAVVWSTTDDFLDPYGNYLVEGDKTYFASIFFFLADGETPFSAGGMLTCDEVQYERNLGGATANTFGVVVDYTYHFIVVGPTFTHTDGNQYYWEYNTGIQEFTTNPSNLTTLVSVNKGSWDMVPIPEPATMALVGIGIVALGLRRRRK